MTRTWHAPSILRWLGATLVLCALPQASCTSEVTIFVRTQTDAFEQAQQRQVDVLLVVDNSCSMIDEQIKLGASFESFISQFVDAEVDYQIGVVTTDMVAEDQRGRLQGDTKIITSEMEFSSAEQLFADNVHVCATGSGFERGLDAARAALSEPVVSTENAGFLRPDAKLAVVFVSDEDDLSMDPVGSYLDFFYGLKGDPAYRDRNLVNLSSVVGDLPAGCEQPSPVVPDCADGLDEADGDGLIDCEDPDCVSSWVCSFDIVGEGDCSDGIDGDSDGALDCADADCGALNICRESECLDGEDDDGDGLTDCADPDCLVGQPENCGELSCFDEGFEHVGGYLNALVDCDDPSCFTDPALAEACFLAGGRAEVDYPERCDLTIAFNPLTGAPAGVDGRDIDDPNSLDNELAGCDDPDCDSYFLCASGLSAERHTSCGDCLDNDNDGFEDCDDVDCASSENCDNPYPIEAGTRYADASIRSGGLVASICADEFSSLVQELGLNISGLRDAFYLTAYPRIGCAITLTLGGAELLEGEAWNYDPEQNRVVFDADSLPQPGAQFSVFYTVDVSPPGSQSGGGTCAEDVAEGT